MAARHWPLAIERFFCGIDDPGNDDECWPWMRVRDKDGYGLFVVDGRHVRTHRYSYEIHSGPIPEGQDVLHSCDNPPCCNPNHLWLGTDADNAADSMRKGRRACGSRHGRAKLTEAQVIELRARYAAGGVVQRELAEDYDISHALVSFITTRRRWRHVA